MKGLHPEAGGISWAKHAAERYIDSALDRELTARGCLTRAEAGNLAQSLFEDHTQLEHLIPLS